MPTGSGKTVVFTTLAKKTIEKDLFSRCLILTDRIELLSQAGGALASSGVLWSPIKAGAEPDLTHRVHVGMIETVCRRIERYVSMIESYDLIIIDECHRGNFFKIFKHISDRTYVIGATATPLAASKKDPLKNYYGGIVCPVQIHDLIEDGFLVPAITYSAKIDRSALRTKMGEYTDESLMDTFDKREVYDGVIDKYRKFAGGRKAICFNVNVAHSLRMRDEFLSAGINCEHVDGTTPPDERTAILARFKAGLTQVLCNVGIVTTGYDEPSVSCIIVNRATKSLPLFLQMAGRGSRLHLPSGKENFILLDMGENYKELGMWEQDRDWIRLFNNPKKPGEGVAPVKSCPECEAIIPASAPACPYCGYEIPKKKDEKKAPKEIEFERIFGVPRSTVAKPHPSTWRRMTVTQMAMTVRAGVYKPGWAIRQIKERCESESQLRSELASFGQFMGYKSGWLSYQMNLDTSQGSWAGLST